jgi:hypothetical protein
MLRCGGEKRLFTSNLVPEKGGGATGGTVSG